MEFKKGNTQKLKTQHFIKRAAVIIILIIIIFHCITIYFDSPSLAKLYRNGYKDIIGVVLVSLSIWWMLEDMFQKEYRCEKGIYIAHFLLAGIVCVSSGSIYAVFDNDAAFLIKLSDKLIQYEYFGGICILYQKLLCGLFLVTAFILVSALFISSKRSGLYYSAVCHSVGAMGLILMVIYTVNEIDVQTHNYFRTINAGVGYGFILYFTGVLLSVFYWKFYKKRAAMTMVRPFVSNNQQFVYRTMGMIIFLVTISFHFLRYWAQIGLDGIEDLNIWWIIVEVGLVMLSVWMIFNETFSDKNSCGIKMYVLHVLLGFLSCTSIVSLYLLHRDNGSMYFLMVELWGDMFGYRVSQ